MTDIKQHLKSTFKFWVFYTQVEISSGLLAAVLHYEKNNHLSQIIIVFRGKKIQMTKFSGGKWYYYHIKMYMFESSGAGVGLESPSFGGQNSLDTSLAYGNHN